MPDAQADVPEDIFLNPSGSKVSPHDIGKKLTLELKQAKQRKKEMKPLPKAEQEAIKMRIDMNKQLAPHYFGEIDIPIAWLKSAKKKPCQS